MSETGFEPGSLRSGWLRWGQEFRGRPLVIRHRWRDAVAAWRLATASGMLNRGPRAANGSGASLSSLGGLDLPAAVLLGSYAISHGSNLGVTDRPTYHNLSQVVISLRTTCKDLSAGVTSLARLELDPPAVAAAVHWKEAGEDEGGSAGEYVPVAVDIFEVDTPSR